MYQYYKQYRLPWYNYASSGLYFFTVVTKNRRRLFGDVVDGVVCLSPDGKIAFESLTKIGKISEYATLDSSIVMPDHIHGIILIQNPDEPRALTTKKFIMQKRSLSSIIGRFKSAVTTRLRKKYRDPTLRVWHERYHDRIIRNEREYLAIRKYIEDNPMQWQTNKNR